ncbi:intermembrane lipid transfer protein VPS13B-like [Arctopsyche grandis]|uniref:intermembrane lipid transfer protein VPS13B-like n=1 Tax=Arctopsyche grandis TaxID=121162 RepID=UPI00406D6E2E
MQLLLASLWREFPGICIEKAGITTLKLKHQNDLSPLTIIVLVENSSPVQLCVTFMGQLIIMNVLPNKFSMKLYHKKVLQLHGLSGSATVSVDAGVRSPSLLFDTSTESAIRLHFVDSDSGWSGDIPLIECSKGNMPWLVKGDGQFFPVKGEIQYISIWCRITKDNVHKRTLVTLSPLYILRSHLPTNVSVSPALSCNKYVKLHTEKYSQSSVYSVDGRGSIHFITTPGITETKHELVVSNVENANLNECDNKICLHYDMVDQLTFFPNKEDVVDIDAILFNMKQWSENSTSECEWPYIFSEDGLQWNPVGHQHSTDIVVRYLPAIRGIDSMVVDMAPWALFGNCSGLRVNLHGPNGEELCTVNHLEVIIPPPIITKESFFCRVHFTSETYLSGPLRILSTALGPYERKPQGCVSYEGTSTFTVDCNQSICVFSMAYEMKQNINIFRLSSNYVFVNQLPLDIMVLPIAMHLSTPNIYLPQNATEMSVTIPSTQNSCVGIPINKFHVLPTPSTSKSKDSSEDENFLLYIYLRYSLDSPFSCPIRLDKFSQRRSVSVKSSSKSIPVVLSCQEYRGQVFITAHKDTSPQFLIMNKANITITIAQVLKEFVTTDTYNYDTKHEFLPKNVVEECWNSDWHCTLQPGEEVYYTMPMQSIQYPELFSGTSSGFEDNLYLTFAYVKNTECNSHTWSVPVDVGTNSLEKFVKLPGYVEDIKVMVNSHCFATTVIVNNVTQDDISASDIRQRLLISMPTEIMESSLENVHDFSSKSPELPDLAERDDNFETSDCQSDQENVWLLENAYSANTEPSPSLSFNDSNLGTFLKVFKITSIFDGVNICMIMNKDANEGSRSCNVFSLICDSVVGTCSPSNKGFLTHLTIGDLQIDNPLFPNGGFDFHVVIIKQAPALQNSTDASIDWKPLIGSQICNISKVVDALRQNCLFKCEVNMEMWDECSVTYSGLYDLQVTIGPISLYVEDTYISTLLDYFTDFVPVSLPTTCSHVNNFTHLDSDENGSVTFVSIPEYIIWEGSAIAHPIKFKKLLIHPLNILLSLHSSMVLYIALDHSPLQFAKFERINVLTSSYRLGHALTMHYLSEAIFGAGWVVGSLEILGSPGGLARRVSAGLRDLVREPCRGLMRGPWGFVVGMTHGSASLLKHLTQGTVESMSMVMGSVARNLDRLSLDEDHMRRTERARRHRPDGLVQALTRGLQGLGLSLLGAIGGIAHEALVVGYEKGGSPVAVAAGLTRGLMGVITKPLSATADFLALTGQGLLCQAGWDQHPMPRWTPIKNNSTPSKNENFRLKLGNTFACSSLLYICQGINRDTGLNVTIVITNKCDGQNKTHELNKHREEIVDICFKHF